MNPYDRELRQEFQFNAPLNKVWNCWTTEEGVQNFLCNNCTIGNAPGDPYEVYFATNLPKGKQGSENCTILATEPMKRFTFTWNAPPTLPNVRNQHTVVELRFKELDDSTTRLTLIHRGWGEGPEWDQAYTYFQRAWFEIVIPRLKKYLSGEDPWMD